MKQVDGHTIYHVNISQSHIQVQDLLLTYLKW